MTKRAVIWIAVTVAAAAVLAGLVSVSGLRFYTVMTPSMGIAAPVGTLIVTRPAAAYQVGDIVTYERNGRSFTHRIIEAEPDGAFITKGDLNGAVDPLPVGMTQIVGQAVSIVPGLGWVWRGLPGLLVGALIIYAVSLFRRFDHTWRWVIRISGWTLVFCLVAVWLHPWVSLSQLTWSPSELGGVEMHVVNTGLFPLDALGHRLASGQDAIVHVTEHNAQGQYTLTPTLGLHWWEQVGLFLLCLIPLALSLLIRNGDVEPTRAIEDGSRGAATAENDDPAAAQAEPVGSGPSNKRIDAQAGPSERLRRVILIAAIVLAMIVGVAVVTFTTTSSALTAKVTNNTNTAGTRTFFNCRNAISSLGTGGTTVAFAMGTASTRSETDLVRTNNAGTYNSNTTTNSSVGCLRDPARSVTYNGTSQCLASKSTYDNPQTFSLEAWFATNSTKAGKVIGFGETKYDATESTYDRHVYVDNNGHVVFGIYTNGYRTISSPLGTYNDGKWHHVIATYAGGTNGGGTKLYLDGTLVKSGPTYTNAEDKVGYWKVGCGNLDDWPDAEGTTFTSKTSEAWFQGLIQYSAVYSRVLSDTEVLEHYLAGVG